MFFPPFLKFLTCLHSEHGDESDSVVESQFAGFEAVGGDASVFFVCRQRHHTQKKVPRVDGFVLEPSGPQAGEVPDLPELGVAVNLVEALF